MPVERPLALGIETGGTASRWCLVDRAGAVVARGEIAPMTGHLFGEAAIARVRGIFCGLAGELDRFGVPIAILAGFTGLGSGGDTHALLTGLLSATIRCPPEAVRVVDDMWLGYRARFAPGEGILVYAGTGSIGYHLTMEGDIVRAGGRGILVDDGGSAAWIAARALRLVLRREDEEPGSGWAGGLGGALAEALGGASWEAARVHIYGGDRGTLGLLARAVAAAQDDPDARRIFERAGEELARLARALRHRVGGLPVALGGRALNLSPVIGERFAALVPPPLAVRQGDVDIAAEAARLAWSQRCPRAATPAGSGGE